MPKSAIVEPNPGSAIDRPKRSRKARVRNADPSESQAIARQGIPSSTFPTKPLLVGVGIGAALALTAVALGSRPGKPAYFSPTPPTVAGALAKTAALFLARFVARRAIAAAANQGARKLASAWPL